jgi:hypothetical protein
MSVRRAPAPKPPTTFAALDGSEPPIQLAPIKWLNEQHFKQLCDEGKLSREFQRQLTEMAQGASAPVDGSAQAALAAQGAPVMDRTGAR